MRRVQRNASVYSSNEYDRQDPPYQEEAPGAYNQEQGYDENGQPYADEQYYEEETQGDEVVSTSQAINLTCTLAAVSGLFALFLYFADRRSEAVRRISVQSVALTGGFLSASLVIWIFGSLFRLIPFLGIIIAVIFWMVFVALLLVTLYLKVQMMLNAYKGLAYQLPFVGSHIRNFE